MTLQDTEITMLDDTQTTFGDLTNGRVALVVNVASRCGLAPQYEQLEELQKRFGDKHFTVVGFPSNQFLQELGSSDAISEYCSTTWGVSFPMTEKVRLNGKKAHPLYQQLTENPDANGKAGRVSWNFEKFLVHPDGRVKRFRPRTVPDDPAIIESIESWLEELDGERTGAPAHRKPPMRSRETQGRGVSTLDPQRRSIARSTVRILLGAALVSGKRQKLVGRATAAFFVAVFPGNVSQWRNRRDAFGLDTDRKRLLRLPFQIPLIAAALWSTREPR